VPYSKEPTTGMLDGLPFSYMRACSARFNSKIRHGPVYSLCNFRISCVAARLAADSDVLSSGVTILRTVRPGAPILSGLWEKRPHASALVFVHR
jgi:hypothetical protein